ncbi:MAG: 4-hydroxythreonine-4-phosphate dehydrogenase PdxA [Rikenellaceae bacterium]|nr:4-hydroxythreonine-4-phosphate dehydrogenase PdxA [Rikenellaceae bacterium]
MSEHKIKVGITHGDINGIGYEIIIKALCDPRVVELFTPVVYGSARAASFYRKGIEGAENFSFNLVASPREANPKRANLINCVDDNIRIEPGTSTPEAGAASAAALNAAVADLKAGLIDVLVTAPINKENVQSDAFRFTGHTEFLAAAAGGRQPLMMMISDTLKVGLLTIHIPVSEVAKGITREGIVSHLQELRESLIRDFGVVEPRIAVLALNPHAGDGGLLGPEENEIIRPAVVEASDKGILAFGPFAADGFFAARSYLKYDAMLAMYHDQGLAPFKALSPDGVNFTAGLPFIRTSPAHGVGYDIAGKGIADESSMREAIYAAIDIFRNRCRRAEMTRRPLQRFERDRGADVSVNDLPQTSDN